jgi:glycosyltransferase involved in cell wall biosynthesis
MSDKNLIVLGDAVPIRHAEIEAFREPRLDFELIRQRTCGQYASAATLKSGVRKAFALGSQPMKAAFAAHEARRPGGAIFTTGEEIAFRLLPLLQASRWDGKLFSVVHASHSWKWRQMARLLGDRHVGAYYTVASAQRDALVHGAGLSPDKVRFIFDSVDTAFFDPAREAAPSGEGYVFACGLENRDYATLARAGGDVKCPVRIQASGYFPNENASDDGLPGNVEINRTRIAYTDLRTRYAGARLVVVPLNAVPYAAGVNGLLEAMAMGKAVIVTGSPGLVDYSGLSSLVKVAPADPAGLARAIEGLWRDPSACADMGAANRQWVLANATLEKFVSTIADDMLAS